MDEEYAPIPSLLAMTAVHNHLVREETRTQVALIIESGEPREVMHFALLIGYGASAVNPYLALETVGPDEKAMANYIKSVNKGLLKTFSKMGISTLQSYRGAQVFEAIGLSKTWWTSISPAPSSRIEGVGLEVLAQEAILKHQHAFAPQTDFDTELAVSGNYQFRARGEYHLYNPQTIQKLQHAVRTESFATFQEYTDLIDKQTRQLCTLRGLLEHQDRRRAGSAGRSGAGEGDRQAIRHRRDELRLDLQGSARDAGHRHEPHRRQEQYRRGRRRRGALRHRDGAARSSRWPARDSASPPTT